MHPRPLPVLCVNDLHVTYGALKALDGLSLKLYAGEMLGLLGPNGAGKTTLINCLAQRQPFIQGEIRIKLPGETADRLGIVPQEIAVYPDLTVRQNLAVFGKLHGVTSGQLRLRILDTLHWAGLQDRQHTLAKSLSGGMQRRLNLACSVLHEPQILLLDEPTVGVDPQSRERIYAMLENLLSGGTAVLLTTHHLEEAQTRCDRIAIMDHGRVLACGSFDDLLQRTIGTSQQVCIRFRDLPPQLPPQLTLSTAGYEAVGLMEDAVYELPALLAELKELNASIEHVTLREPTLQNLFLHLTGKELRE